MKIKKKTTKTKKRNPQDQTGRNIRPLKRRLTLLEQAVKEIKRYLVLE